MAHIVTKQISTASAALTARIIELKDGSGLSYAQIGRKVGLSKQGARDRYLRAHAIPRGVRAATAARLIALRAENRRLNEVLRKMRAIMEGI